MKLEFFLQERYSLHTANAYQGGITCFMRYLEQNNLKVADDPSLFSRYFNWLLETYNPASVNLRLSALRTLCDHWVIEGVITKNYARDCFRMVRVKRKAGKTVTPEQFKQWLEQAPLGSREGAMLALSGMGMKPGEVANLRLSDLKDEGRLIAVGQRLVDISGVERHLIAYVNEHEDEIHQAHGYLFHTLRQTPVRREIIWKEVMRLTNHEASPRDLRAMRRIQLRQMGVVSQL